METAHELAASALSAANKKPRCVPAKGRRIGPSRVDSNPLMCPERPRKASEVPPIYWKACRDCWWGRSPWPLLLAGNVGCGKTCAALAIGDYVAWPQVIETEESLSDQINAIYAGVNEKYRSKKDLIRAWRDAHLATLDDFGSRRDTKAMDDVIIQLLDTRECKPFILTTNLTMQEIEKRFGDRIASRIECGTVVEAFDLEDRR